MSINGIWSFYYFNSLLCLNELLVFAERVNLRYIALICARGGSKGLPDKNILPLDGRPLVGWSIRIAKQIKRISRVIVSTDSQEIAQIAKEQGAEVPFMRPPELARDDSPELLVWQHALDYLENQQCGIDGLMVIPPTAPLRDVRDISNCMEEFEKGEVDVVITVTDAHRNPYFNMVKVDRNGYSSLVNPPTNRISRRQDTPDVFDVTNVAWVACPQFVREHDSTSSLYEGRVRGVYVPPERALDIDTPLDFRIAECLVAEKKGVLHENYT